MTEENKNINQENLPENLPENLRGNSEEKPKEKSKRFSWYPGHIKAAKDQLVNKWLPLLDVVIELIDARVPLSGNYQDAALWNNKALIPVYAKKDLADLNALLNLPSIKNDAFLIDGRSSKKWRRELIQIIKNKCEPTLEKLKSQGRKRNLRVGVCGLPNVGKSTFLNSLSNKAQKLSSRKASAKVENKPGVTRQMNWVPCQEIDLLDTPGLVPFSFEEEKAFKLALCNLLPIKTMDSVFLNNFLVDYISKFYPDTQSSLNLQKNLSEEESLRVITQFQKGKLGNFCLDLDY